MFELGLWQPRSFLLVFHWYHHTDTDTRLRFIPIPILIPGWWFILIPIPILLKLPYRYQVYLPVIWKVLIIANLAAQYPGGFKLLGNMIQRFVVLYKARALTGQNETWAQRELRMPLFKLSTFRAQTKYTVNWLRLSKFLLTKNIILNIDFWPPGNSKVPNNIWLGWKEGHLFCLLRLGKFLWTQNIILHISRLVSLSVC